ncbi:hypothetical protein [uncultured Prevotella sp.]|uniref:hypothetical protein n=1 Tax=uncultured Prevotella sp. TaxID=159272 RepID=UPI00266D1C4B|nr:hypothetical protein [uncultured Prevotella sp.]
MNKYFLYAASVLALASCSSDDFLGENSGNGQNASSAINFSGDAGKITRATSNTGDYVKMLDGQFKIYGVKKMSETQFVTVFKDYSVWNAAANTTTSNTNGWEYVGAKGATNLGTGNISLDKDQTIKFWDYSASEYHFVAGSLIKNFTPDPLIVGKDITYATISGLAGHITANDKDGTGTALETNPVYVSEPVIVKKEKYQEPVQFKFVRQQAMVRVGFYETIPGYSIHNVNFYDAEGNVSNGNNIILTSGTAGYFVGGSNVEGTITYNWTGITPSYTYAYSETGLTKDKNWYAGKLSTLATTSTGKKIDLKDGTKMELLWGTDKDMSTNGYFTVIPTPTATTAAPILIKCDYTLVSDDGSGETIKVTGATAAIPAAFSKWEVNTRYTYLFKISQNTNGYTGDDPTKAGLYPITFDAVVKESTDAMQEGTVTTVSTPSITTYQEGSVTDNGIEYKSGKAINVTVTDANGKVQTLAAGGTAVGSVAVYKFTDAINEAEIQVKGTTGATTVNGEVTGNMFTFTPATEGYYAIQHMTTAATAKTPAAYAYKVVYVKAAPSTIE